MMEKSDEALWDKYAEEYAKELAEQLPKKKVFFTKKSIVFFLIAFALVAGVYLYNNSPIKRMTGGIDYVADHIDDYSFETTKITDYVITIIDGGCIMNAGFPEITDMNIFFPNTVQEKCYFS